MLNYPPYVVASPQSSENEIVSETEDETQAPLLRMPKPTSDDLFLELEHHVALIKESRTKDLEDCERVESVLLRYKAARDDEKKKAVASMNGQLTKAEASLDIAREIIHAAVSLA